MSSGSHPGRSGPPPHGVTALDWYASMPEPALVSRGGGRGHLSLRRYTGTPAEMKQPELVDNLLCLHLGGAKEVRRWHGGRFDTYDVPLGALTIMPAHQSNRWVTRGPIDFAHLELSPALVGRIVAEELDLDPAGLSLTDAVGFRDPYLEQLFAALLEAVEMGAPSQRLYPDSLLVVLVVTLLQRHSTKGAAATRVLDAGAGKGGLPPWKLRRVVDHMTANLAGEIGLGELSELAGISRAQFFRAFKQSTGVSPHRYLTDLRLDAAHALLAGGSHDVAAAAACAGLPASSWFHELFRRRFGVVPRFVRRAD